MVTILQSRAFLLVISPPSLRIKAFSRENSFGFEINWHKMYCSKFIVRNCAQLERGDMSKSCITRTRLNVWRKENSLSVQFTMKQICDEFTKVQTIVENS